MKKYRLRRGSNGRWYVERKVVILNLWRWNIFFWDEVSFPQAPDGFAESQDAYYAITDMVTEDYYVDDEDNLFEYLEDGSE